MDLADLAATDQAAAQPSAWEVLQASPKARPVVRDLRAAPAPDLPAVEVLRSTEPAPKPPQPTPLVPGPSAQARVQARLAQASGAQQPAAAAATGAATATAAALSEADDEALYKLDDEPLWDMDGLEFPDAAATAGPVHEEVEAMAQAFAQEMEAGGALGLGGTRAAAAPVAPSLAPTQHVEAVQDVAPAAIAPAQPAQAVPAGADMERDDGGTDAPASRAATPPAAAQTPPKPAAEREVEHDGEAGAHVADLAHLQDGADDTADVDDVKGAAPAQKEEKHPAVPEFMKQAQRKAWWNQPAVRFVMGMLVMLLPLALALQIVVQERNALAAWQPQWRPALENLCVALDCTLAPRQDIAAVVVADSHFAATGAPFAYQLELALHNRSGAAVAMPALEVTLTDSQEQVLVRKVLQPQDLGAPTELGPRAEWALKLPVTTQGLHLPVSGYRLTVFYP